MFCIWILLETTLSKALASLLLWLKGLSPPPGNTWRKCGHTDSSLLVVNSLKGGSGLVEMNETLAILIWKMPHKAPVPGQYNVNLNLFLTLFEPLILLITQVHAISLATAMTKTIAMSDRHFLWPLQWPWLFQSFFGASDLVDIPSSRNLSLCT